MRSSLNPFGSPAVLIDKLIGEAYDNVKIVADNLTKILVLAENIEELDTLRDSVEAAVASTAGAVIAANNAATNANAVAASISSVNAELMTEVSSLALQTADLAAQVLLQSEAENITYDGDVNVKEKIEKIINDFQLNGVPVMMMPGVAGNGIADDTAAVQAAIDMAFTLGAGSVVFPGEKFTFNIASPSYAYGTFTGPNGAVPFNRGTIMLRSGVSLLGSGAELLFSGGRNYPGSLFYNRFWEGVSSAVRNVRISGLKLNGNMSQQVVVNYPANTPDGQVWQHGSAINIGWGSGIEIDHCKIHGWRGNGILVFSDEHDQNSAAYIGDYMRGVRIHNNEIYDCFGNGITGNGIDWEIYQNYIHGDGFWVAGIDIEMGWFYNRQQKINIHHNLFDFRDGLSPTERTPQYASNSPTAQGLRRHLRRACSFGFFYDGFPSNTFNGATENISFTQNIIYQGVMDAWNHCDVLVAFNKFLNTYEDVSAHSLISGNCLTVTNGDVIGMKNAKILENIIDSDLDGFGILVHAFDEISVKGNHVTKTRNAGIRLESCGGICKENQIENVGRTGTGGLPHSVSSGITVFGGNPNPLDISDNVMIESRENEDKKMTYGIYANVDAPSGLAITTISDNVASGMENNIVLDQNNSAVKVGNHHPDENLYEVGLSAIVLGNLGVFGTHTVYGDADIQGLLNVDGNASIGGSLTVGGETGDTTVEIRGGDNIKIAFVGSGGMEYQIAQTADGGFVLQNFLNGVYQRTDIIAHSQGALGLSLNWEKPLISSDATALWVYEKKLYGKEGYNPANSTTWPTSGTDGIIIGSYSGDAEGSLSAGEWKELPGIYKFYLSGSGNVTIDTRTFAGVVAENVVTLVADGTPNQIVYHVFDDTIAEIRAEFTGSATAEIV